MSNKTYIFGKSDAPNDLKRIEEEIINLHERENVFVILSDFLGSFSATSPEEVQAALKESDCIERTSILELGLKLNVPVFGIDVAGGYGKKPNPDVVASRNGLYIAEMIRNIKSVKNAVVIVSDAYLYGALIPGVTNDTSKVIKFFLNDPDVVIHKSPAMVESENNIVAIHGIDWNGYVYERLAVLANALVEDERQFVNKEFRIKGKTKENVYTRHDFLSSNKVFFCHVKDNNIIAVLSAEKRNNNIISFGTAYTVPEERNKGIMTSLFEVAFTVFPKDNFVYYVGALHKNAGAIRLYQKLGFVTEQITMMLVE